MFKGRPDSPEKKGKETQYIYVVTVFRVPIELSIVSETTSSRDAVQFVGNNKITIDNFKCITIVVIIPDFKSPIYLP
jgi:hypothetical protein